MAIQFRPYGKKVGDALQKLLREEFPGTPIMYSNREQYRATSVQHWGLLPGDTNVIATYNGGSLREYSYQIRYYVRKPRSTNHFQTNIHNYLSDKSERLIRLIDSKNKHDDQNVFFGELDLTFGSIPDFFSDIIAYRWHNARIESVDFDPPRTDKETKNDLQIMEAQFICNVMEIN